MRGTGSIPRLNLLLLTGPMRRVTLIWMAVPRSFEHLAGERLEPEKDDTSKMCGDRSASWDLTHIRGRLVATNADVVRGNSRLMPNRHCVSCTVGACLLLVIGVPAKSGFGKFTQQRDSVNRSFRKPLPRNVKFRLGCCCRHVQDHRQTCIAFAHRPELSP